MAALCASWGASARCSGTPEKLSASDPTKATRVNNQLFYGDNLHILRDSIADETVDLIYLDPPFNSQRAPTTCCSRTRAGTQADGADHGLRGHLALGPAGRGRRSARSCSTRNADVAEMMRALRSFLGENDMMAYLVMMAARLVELHRVLKPTGSLYLHCDPTASHYLKIVLDAVFGPENFRNRDHLEADERHSELARRYGAGSTTSFFFYSKSSRFTLEHSYTQHTTTSTLTSDFDMSRR